MWHIDHVGGASERRVSGVISFVCFAPRVIRKLPETCKRGGVMLSSMPTRFMRLGTISGKLIIGIRIILIGAQTTISRNSIFGKLQDNSIRTRLPGAMASAPSSHSSVSIWYPMSFLTGKSPSDNVFVRVTGRMRNSNRMMEFAGTLKGSKAQTLFHWVPRLLFSFSSASGRSLTTRLKCQSPDLSAVNGYKRTATDRWPDCRVTVVSYLATLLCPM